MGTIWLVTQLVSKGLIEVDIARAAYLKMKASGRRLPWQIAEEKLTAIEQEKIIITHINYCESLFTIPKS